MKINAEGLKLLKEFEGFKNHAYRDGGGVLTIGYGHTGPDVHADSVWSKEKCDATLESDLADREEQLTGWLENIPTTENQFSALLCLGYNIGMYALKNESSAFENHCMGRYNQASAAFMHWVKDNGVIVGGLVRRRKAEMNLYRKESQ